MATEKEHLDQASHNQDMLCATDPNRFPDWVATVAFYQAVHLVEAMFVRKGLTNQSGSHVRRNQLLKRTFADLWKQYQPLYAFSRLARYRCYPVKPDHTVYVLRRLGRVEQIIQGL